MNSKSGIRTLLSIAGIFLLSSIGFSNPINLAVGKSAAESDHGWGGGTNKQDITDGITTYQNWWHGLAFTGGNNYWGGEPAGPRQATINFGSMVTFNEVTLWHRGEDHIPVNTWLDFWNGATWTPIVSTRLLGGESDGPYDWAHSIKDDYTFSAVTGSKVRYRFDNSLPNITGKGDYHGWLYEFEVYNKPGSSVPSPAAAIPMVVGLVVVWLRKRRA